MKYPIGTQTFKTLIEEGMVYVDKTDLVYELAQKHVCFLSRPSVSTTLGDGWRQWSVK